jgi:putative ABC transport system permease protein
MLAVVVGMVLASPAAIRALAAPAGRLPFATRLALRDLVRHQARAAAALAAITLGLAISVAVVVVAKANEYRSAEGNLSSSQLVIRAGDPKTTPDPSLNRADRDRLDAAATKVAGAVRDSALFTLDVAFKSSTAGDPSVREPVGVARAVGSGTFRGLGLPYVATPQLLRHYGIDAGSIDDGTDLLTSLQGDVLLLDVSKRPGVGMGRTAVRRVDLPSYTSAPNSLVTESALRRRGWVPARAGWLVETPEPLTADQIAAARTAAADAGLTVEARSTQDDLAAVRNVATTVGALLALAIVAMTIGLIRGEAVRDLRTLTATGAAPRTRRALTASAAAALALLGVVLGTAGAYLALLAAYHADLGRLAPPPVAQLLLLAVGLPVLATVAGWLLAGREPRTFARQALE